MPVVLRKQGFRFWFYSADLDEPPHVHVGRSGNEAKFWLTPIAVARTGQFRDHELNQIERILTAHVDELLLLWQQEVDKRGNG